MHRHSLGTLVADDRLLVAGRSGFLAGGAPAMVYILRLQGGSSAAQTGLLSVGDAVGRNAGSRGAHVAGATLIDGHGPARSRKIRGTIMQSVPLTPLNEVNRV